MGSGADEVVLMWQITWDEYGKDAFRPVRKPMHIGSWSYECPLCGMPVGIYRIDEGMIYKRDQCKNGHKIDWT